MGGRAKPCVWGLLETGAGRWGRRRQRGRVGEREKENRGEEGEKGAERGEREEGTETETQRQNVFPKLENNIVNTNKYVTGAKHKHQGLRV